MFNHIHLINNIGPLKSDKAKLKEVLILFPTHREGLTSYLSPILGQYAIKNIDFLATFTEEFNKKTDNLLVSYLNTEKIEENGLTDFELVIPLKLKVYKAGKFGLTINYPQLTFLQKEYFKKRKRIFKLIRNWAKRSVIIPYPFANYKNNIQLLLFRYLNETSLGNFTKLGEQLKSLQTSFSTELNSLSFRKYYRMLRQRIKNYKK